ncbi:MAG: hypothetical protein KGD66_07610 [Candidatus Lokiarchaeota archaeon]|nr:hypothetical protein [Candidatus Lokiarchaeota archaeon]
MLNKDISPILCISGAIASFVSYIYHCTYSSYWCVMPFYYLLPIAGIIAIAGLGIRYKIMGVGSIICFCAGLMYPAFFFMFSPLYAFHIIFSFTLPLLPIQIPLWLLLLGGYRKFYIMAKGD